MKRFLVSLALLSLVTGCASAPSNQKSASSEEKASLLIEMAVGALIDRDITAALQALADAEKYDSKNPRLYYTRGLAFYQKKDINATMENVKKALDLNEKYSAANNTLGKLLLDAGKPSEAEPYLKKAASDSLFTEAFKAHTNLGILYYRRADHERARKHFEKATIESSAAACVAHYYMGHIHIREGKFKEAIRAYDNSVKRNCSNFPDAHLALGIAYERNRQYDLARKKFLDIRQSFPDTTVAEKAIEHLKGLP